MLAWTGVKDSGRGCTLSRIGFEQLTRPKSFHARRVARELTSSYARDPPRFAQRAVQRGVLGAGTRPPGSRASQSRKRPLARKASRKAPRRSAGRIFGAMPPPSQTPPLATVHAARGRRPRRRSSARTGRARRRRAGSSPRSAAALIAAARSPSAAGARMARAARSSRAGSRGCARGPGPRRRPRAARARRRPREVLRAARRSSASVRGEGRVAALAGRATRARRHRSRARRRRGPCRRPAPRRRARPPRARLERREAVARAARCMPSALATRSFSSATRGGAERARDAGRLDPPGQVGQRRSRRRSTGPAAAIATAASAGVPTPARKSRASDSKSGQSWLATVRRTRAAPPASGASASAVLVPPTSAASTQRSRGGRTFTIRFRSARPGARARR